MSAQYQAIETKYKGYRFRSRLEAKWAVFFDAMGIKWEYEPEGFQATVNGKTYYYLPDFYFPESGYYGEVKGKPFTPEESSKMAVAVFSGCLGKGLILLGNIPEDKFLGDVTYKLLVQPDKSDLSSWAWGACIWLRTDESGKLGEWFLPYQEDDRPCGYLSPNEYAETDAGGATPNIPYLSAEPLNDVECTCIMDKDSWYKTCEAYGNAREARFEHGESGIATHEAKPDEHHEYTLNEIGQKLDKLLELCGEKKKRKTTRKSRSTEAKA